MSYAAQVIDISKAAELMIERYGFKARCWYYGARMHLSGGFKCQVGTGGAGCSHVVLGRGHTWEQALRNAGLLQPMNCAADECGYNIGVGRIPVCDMDEIDWAELVKPKHPVTWVYGEQIVPWPKIAPYIPLWSKPETGVHSNPGGSTK